MKVMGTNSASDLIGQIEERMNRSAAKQYQHYDTFSDLPLTLSYPVAVGTYAIVDRGTSGKSEVYQAVAGETEGTLKWEPTDVDMGGDGVSKQNKILDTPLTIGGSLQTTVEGALGGLTDLVPNGASGSNKLVSESANYPKVFVSGYHIVETVYKFVLSDLTQTEFLINIGYGGEILLGIHTRTDKVTAIQLGSQGGSVSSATSPTIKTSADGLTVYIRVGSDTPLTITQLYPSKYNGVSITMETVSSSDSGYTSATQLTIKRALTASDLTASVTSGSSAPVTSGGVAAALQTTMKSYLPSFNKNESVVLKMSSTEYRNVKIWMDSEYYEFIIHEWGGICKWHWIVGSALPSWITSSYSSYRLTLTNTNATLARMIVECRDSDPID